MTRRRYLYFPGCKLKPRLPEYDRATRGVLETLEIELSDSELNCCGFPVRHLDFTASMLCGARVLAVAARKGLALLTPCKCCFGNLKQADYWLRRDSALRERINGLLRREGLAWSRDVTVRHLLNALTEDVGLEHIASKIKHPLTGLKAAAHYGCHALRPGDVTQFDNPLSPTLFERVIAAAGATCIEWPLRLECCGHPLWEKNNRLALSLMRRKLADAHEAGAQALITACTYCQIQFDAVRREHPSGNQAHDRLPAILVTQLLGVALGLSKETLGLTSGTLIFGNGRAE
ncbi:MAG: CoB--CoM heterodisulfide reductase [Desulfobacteraceae bacterium]|nr:MAG: CoB--CoM heterodisulfide reductase [Desulfobacteraceae bacterium]